MNIEYTGNGSTSCTQIFFTTVREAKLKCGTTVKKNDITPPASKVWHELNAHN